jgi:hypothetical protein
MGIYGINPKSAALYVIADKQHSCHRGILRHEVYASINMILFLGRLSPELRPSDVREISKLSKESLYVEFTSW